MTEFYTNEIDEKGNPIKHVHIPENAQHLINQMVERAFERMCVNSGIPKDAEERQDFFHWLKALRKYGNKIISLLVSAAVGGIIVVVGLFAKLYYAGVL
jgi:hypothetical protein